MSEISTPGNPNLLYNSELVDQTNLLLADIMNNPGIVGADVEDGSYLKTEAENETHEKLDVDRSGVQLEASRDRTHEPGVNPAGVFVETIIILTRISDIARVHMMTVGGKLRSVQYDDQFGQKTGMDGLEESLEAIRFAVSELQSSASHTA